MPQDRLDMIFERFGQVEKTSVEFADVYSL
jgi:hypothetical protein